MMIPLALARGAPCSEDGGCWCQSFSGMHSSSFSGARPWDCRGTAWQKNNLKSQCP